MYTYRYPHPAVTADVVLWRTSPQNETPSVLLIRRGNDPFRGCWALPGGFMEIAETSEACARRELREETGIDLASVPLRRVGVYDAVDRDPRERILSIAYSATVSGDRIPDAGDDAAEARFFPLSGLPPLAFDHEKIIRDAATLFFLSPNS